MRPRASTLALRVGEQGRGAFAQGGGAVGGELQDTAEAGLGLLKGVDAGELKLVALHVEAHLSIFHVAGGMGERRRSR